jgi:hypothetical protein
MRIKLLGNLKDLPSAAGTTVGYWRFTEPNNGGELEIYCLRTCDWRYTLAVLGHEIIEALYCKLTHVTTEACDKFDIMIEKEYETGVKPYEEEGGFDKRSPYRWGHIMGAVWEYLIIHATFASWKKYDVECNKLMEIKGDSNA